MNNFYHITQIPVPGKRLLKFCGDIQDFTLILPQSDKGSAWLRTNIGHIETSRREIIREVRDNVPPLGSDWFDIPMKQIDDRHFKVSIPLCEVGHFEGKCFFLKEGESNPVWPSGANTVINVEPADTCCANIIYNTFVRQFGPNKKGDAVPKPSEEILIQTLDRTGYTVIPPSGTFRDLIKELDFIIGEMGCNILQLLPVHPTPTTYARMGRFGNPYAALHFTAIDPALAEFDPRATPLEQFIELVGAIHARNAKIFIDIAINHTGWAASLHETHPQWLARDSEGRIEVPGAWGVIWEDLTRLDYTHKDLWQYMADIFITWCRRGVDGFRGDAGYMIPVPAWKYIVAVVRDQYPDTIFLLEGLGGEISLMQEILNTANFNWAYSELFQNYDRYQIESYMPRNWEISSGEGILVHFAETHDNLRLAARSKTFARMRTALCALFSQNGAFGFANGVEWYATEKINVHGSPSLNWGAECNQVDHIRRINQLLKNHPTFHDQVKLALVQKDGGNQVGLLRHHLPTGKKLLIIVNLDDVKQNLGCWDTRQVGMSGTVYIDLLTKEKISVNPSGSNHTYLLDPGQVLCLTDDYSDIDLVYRNSNKRFLLPKRIEKQCLHAKALDIFRYYNGTQDLGEFDPDEAACQLFEDPLEFCRHLNHLSLEPRVITWQWPRDARREVMVPPEHFLLIRSDTAFRAKMMGNSRCLAQENSLRSADGSFFVLFLPLHTPEIHQTYTLKMSVYTLGRCEHVKAPILFLSHPEAAKVKIVFNRTQLQQKSLLFLGTNGRGGMLRASVDWGKLGSRYDALLAANLNPEFPEDRWIMLTRCRAWIVFQDYSQEIRFDCFHSFCFDTQSRAFWRYYIPTGQGEHILLIIMIEMVSGQNAMRIVFRRQPAQKQAGKLDDKKPIRLILRPDIENRSFHDTTKAYMGPEHIWPQAVTSHSKGFVFAPEPEHTLSVGISTGSFVWQPEWNYMVNHPVEAERGLDPDSDLFSPGYFFASLKGKQTVELTACIGDSCDSKPLSLQPFDWNLEPAVFEENIFREPIEVFQQALEHFLVKRASLKTVIAGYPWFLDWGRDSLIFARGLIALKRSEDAGAILKQFGQYEENGTLPNMIKGTDAGNRDTTDAPLWFFVSSADLVHIEGNDAFLELPCGDRTLRQVLFSIVRAFIHGTKNGIRMDPESGLIFSPAHFTWMDTNYPAGTPREGYPIEIQALWYFALSFLGQIDSPAGRSDWKNMARLVQRSIFELFWIEKEGYLSDCLHAHPGVSAIQAERDDALRPNQLLAVTMGAVAEKRICRKIVATCEELLVPGAIRSLADRDVQYPLKIVHHGNVINNPNHPYQGRYAGDEDTSRKPAYHNGTAWTWLFPTFCEAWVKAYGESSKETALSWLSSSTRLICRGCVGQLPEILDGDFPHQQRGCDAQAWGVSELLRVWLQLIA
ncbi:MAG: glycogen debranching enzyme N-terminal domain-containing protein [Desulfobacterales bacterium]|nr:glycogen debranching enzyme N-terminal domain-containing protein [Desulfobacterales bacterium]